MRACISCRKLFKGSGRRCEDCRERRDRLEASSRALREPWRDWCYQDARWPEARDACLERDDYQCRAMLSDGSRCPVESGLQAHHLKPLSQLWRESGDPFRLSNLVSLCGQHHALADAVRREGER